MLTLPLSAARQWLRYLDVTANRLRERHCLPPLQLAPGRKVIQSIGERRPRYGLHAARAFLFDKSDRVIGRWQNHRAKRLLPMLTITNASRLKNSTSTARTPVLQNTRWGTSRPRP